MTKIICDFSTFTSNFRKQVLGVLAILVGYWAIIAAICIKPFYVKCGGTANAVRHNLICKIRFPIWFETELWHRNSRRPQQSGRDVPHRSTPYAQTSHHDAGCAWPSPRLHQWHRGSKGLIDTLCPPHSLKYHFSKGISPLTLQRSTTICRE